MNYLWWMLALAGVAALVRLSFYRERINDLKTRIEHDKSKHAEFEMLRDCISNYQTREQILDYLSAVALSWKEAQNDAEQLLAEDRYKMYWPLVSRKTLAVERSSL